MNDIVEQPQPKTAYERLPRRYRRFVDEYVSGKTAVDAIRAAGSKSKHARTIACRLLQTPDIDEAVQERTRFFVAELGVRHERLIREMYAVATSDVRKLMDAEGKQIPLHKLDDATAAAIASVDIEQISTQGLEGTRYKYKFWDKNKAAEKLGVYLKLWDAKQVNLNVDNRSVHINTANGAEALQGAVRLLEQVRSIAVSSTATVSDQDRLVLPAQVRDEPTGRGAPVDVSPDKRGAK